MITVSIRFKLYRAKNDINKIIVQICIKYYLKYGHEINEVDYKLEE